MTVSMQITKRIYQGNGVTTQWDVDFPVLSAEDVKVYVTSPQGVEEEVTSGYTFDLLSHTLTYPTEESGKTALPQGWSLTLLRQTPFTQEIDLIRQGELDAEVLEEGYDKLTLLVQELNEKAQRSIRYPVSTQESNMEAEQFFNNIQSVKQTAQEAASQAQDFASQAQTAAASAQTEQEQAAGWMQQAQSAAEKSSQVQVAAESAQLAAETAQTAAESAQDLAQTAQTQAEGAASSAVAASAEAKSSALLAQKWAVYTDAAVEDGAYSAKYYAQQAASSASASGSAQTGAQAAQTAAEEAHTQAEASAAAAAHSAESASQSAQTCQNLVDTLGNPAKQDLSNVTSISASSAVQTALDAKAAVDLSNVSWEAVTPTVAFLQKGFKVCLPDLSDGYIDIAENTPYTCPQDGWVWTQGYFSGAAGQTITASVNDNALPNIGYNASSTYNFDSPQWFPVAKGDVWLCNRASRFYGLRG